MAAAIAAIDRALEDPVRHSDSGSGELPGEHLRRRPTALLARLKRQPISGCNTADVSSQTS